MHSNLSSIKNCPARHRLAIQLQNIKAKLKTISEARLSYESKYANKTIQTQLPAKESLRYNKDDEALYARDTQLVGIEKPKQDLISRLFEDDSQLRVISILGMGGLGKTTLVKQVYDDVAVKSRFQMRAWIAVSQTYDMEKLLKSIIAELCENSNAPSPSGLEWMDAHKLKQQIRNILQQARYLIVLDDVWDEQFWDAFKFAFPENNYNGNHVLLTTRVVRVASAACSEPYRMQPLGSEESWALFCRKTFKDSCCPAHLKEVVEGIVDKCGGLPLAIVAMGGVLASKDLSRKDIWEMALSRLGDESEGIGKIDRAKRILRLSYEDLPSYLKSCFLYIGVYLENEEINCLDLIDGWVVERFVEKGSGMDIQEVAWTYINELSNRSLIIVSDFDPKGLPLSFRIHDLLRELIIYESREINLMTVVGSSQHTGVKWPPEKVARRLVFHGDNALRDCFNQESRCHVQKVRSIIIRDCKIPPKALFAQVLSSKLLKVLSIQSWDLHDIPKEVFRLFHLTYLNLCSTKVKRVPKSIKRLPNLEYLGLGATDVMKLPKQVLKLQKLRVIFVYRRIDHPILGLVRTGFKAPSNFGALSELRVLRDIDVSENKETRILSDIGKLTRLTVFGVTNLRGEDAKDLSSTLEKLSKLHHLYVTCSVDPQCGDEVTLLNLNHPIHAESLQHLIALELVGRLENMPSWVLNLQNLMSLRLSWSSLRDDPLETLQLLPNLMFLSLSRAYQGETLCFKAGCFLKLKMLAINDMEGLRCITVEEGAMPCIKELYLKKLPLLEDVPVGFQHLSQLQLLEFADLGDKLNNKLIAEEFKTSGEYTRIAHIPQVRILYVRDGTRVLHPITTSKRP